jgi:hypothetical protein
VGPGAWEANVEVERSASIRVLRKGIIKGWHGRKETTGPGIGAGGAGGSQLAHHEMPRCGPSGAYGGDEGLRRERASP